MNATYARGVQALCGADPAPATAPPPAKTPEKWSISADTVFVGCGVAALLGLGLVAGGIVKHHPGATVTGGVLLGVDALAAGAVYAITKGFGGGT